MYAKIKLLWDIWLCSVPRMSDFCVGGGIVIELCKRNQHVTTQTQETVGF